MNCPSCQSDNTDKSRYCGRCRMRFSFPNIFWTKVRDHIFWVLRRANAGFVSGMAAWFFVPMLSGALSIYSRDWLAYLFEGLLGGAFLGTVDGMVEESNPKTVRGALWGGLGGALGGALFGYFSGDLTADQISWGIFLFWGIAGGFIGSVSGAWERKPGKLRIAILFGFIGGGLGGHLSLTTYAFLLKAHPSAHWMWDKVYQVFTGGILGITMWFFIGLAERLFVFARRPLGDKSFKPCDKCGTENVLQSWYCHHCGSVLQVAAPAAKLHLPKYGTLDRVSQALRFLSRLSATTGIVASLVFAGIYIFTPVRALVSVVLVGGIGYIFLIIFSSLSEVIRSSFLE